MAHAGGFLDVQGTCQMVSLMLRGESTGTTTVRLTSDGSGTATSSNQFTLASGTSMAFLIHVIGVQNTGSNVGHAIRRTAVKNTAGTMQTVYAASAVGSDFLPASWVVAIGIDDTLDCLTVTCNAAAGQTVKWAAYIEAVEVTY
jgi:hypothetical protein